MSFICIYFFIYVYIKIYRVSVNLIAKVINIEVVLGILQSIIESTLGFLHFY